MGLLSDYLIGMIKISLKERGIGSRFRNLRWVNFKTNVKMIFFSVSNPLLPQVIFLFI